MSLDTLTMLFLLETGNAVGLGGTGGAADCSFCFIAGKFVLEDAAGWLEGGVELA